MGSQHQALLEAMVSLCVYWLGGGGGGAGGDLVLAVSAASA